MTLDKIIDFATTPAVLYVSLFISGGICYEWCVHLLTKAERTSTFWQRWRMKNLAHTGVLIFRNNWFIRHFIDVEKHLSDLNKRLSFFDLPQVPGQLSDVPDVNAFFAEYLKYIESGKNDFARSMYSSMLPRLKFEERQILSKQDTEEETPH